MAETMKQTDKASARYTEHYAGSRGRYCSRCGYFKEPHRCRRVVGTINPGGSCKYWEPRLGSVVVAVSIPGTEHGR